MWILFDYIYYSCCRFYRQFREEAYSWNGSGIIVAILCHSLFSMGIIAIIDNFLSSNPFFFISTFISTISLIIFCLIIK